LFPLSHIFVHSGNISFRNFISLVKSDNEGGFRPRAPN
jgi:hypothetical protein